MAFNDRDIPGESLFERGIIGIGDRLGLLAGVVLAVSAFTGWYSGEGEGVKASVMGWDTGYAGKVVFFLGIAVVVVIALRELGVNAVAIRRMRNRPLRSCLWQLLSGRVHMQITSGKGPSRTSRSSSRSSMTTSWSLSAVSSMAAATPSTRQRRSSTAEQYDESRPTATCGTRL